MRTEQMDNFLEQAVRIVKEGKKKGVVMRIMGAIAVRIHCQEFRHLLDAMKRELTDIDLMTLSKFREDVKDLLQDFGFVANERFIALHGKYRHIYYHKKSHVKVDVFFDKLDMCHTIDFRGRLEYDFPTITLADLLLEKMQIVELTEKDIKDTIILLREHKIGEIEDETINAKYIAKVLANDWGFYHTVSNNLEKVKHFLDIYKDLTDEDRLYVRERIDKLIGYINREPKSLTWKLRAKVGTKKKWYKEVESLQ